MPRTPEILRVSVVTSLLFAAAALAGPPSLFGRQYIGTTNLSPRAVALADTNNDGNLDLITLCNSSGGTDGLYVTLGFGDGTYGSALFSNSLGNPGLLAVCDLNGDGDVDVVTGAPASVNFIESMGDGSGTFAQTGGFSLPSGILAIASGELDGDAGDELVFGLQNATVLLTRSAGGGSVVNSGSPMQDLEIADVNGDGVNDLVGVDAAGTVSVWINRGGGVFGARLGFPTAGAKDHVEVGDVSGDGNADIVVSGVFGDTGVLLGDGSGVSFAAEDLTGLGGSLAGLELADMTGDGVADIVRNFSSVMLGSATVEVIRRDGVGMYTVVDIEGLPGGVTTTGIAVGDVDNDGDIDVCSSNGGTNDTSTVLNETVPAGGVACPGDADDSGVVDFNDLVATLFLFGPCPE